MAEPNPIPNDLPSVWEEVIKDMHARNELGKQRYGTPLQPLNGRNCIQDAYEEALDLSVYLKQAILEIAFYKTVILKIHKLYPSIVTDMVEETKKEMRNGN